MAEDKKSFVLYNDQGDVFDQLSDIKAGQLIKHLFDYVRDKNPESNDPMINLAFTAIKQQLKRDLIKYETKRDVNSKAGREGNLKRWHKDLYEKYKKGELILEDAETIAKDRKTSPPDEGESPPIAKIAVNDTDTVNDTDSVNDTDTKKKKKDAPKKDRSSPDINTLISYLKEKIGMSLDGSQKENRYAASNLLKKIKKDYPDKDGVDSIKVLIDFGIKDKFWGKNMTSFKFIYNNVGKIINSIKNGKGKRIASTDEVDEAVRRTKPNSG